MRKVAIGFVVVLVVLALLSAAAPAKAASDTDGFYCSWIKAQGGWVARVGYNVYCDRVFNPPIVSANDVRSNPYTDVSLPGTLGKWAAGIK